MAKTNQAPTFVRIANIMSKFLLRLGIKMVGDTALLTVKGRKSGLPRTTPVTPVKVDGQRVLVAPYGAVDWVRNLRAAGEGTLSRGRYQEHISAVELSIPEAAPVLKKALPLAPQMLHQYFEV